MGRKAQPEGRRSRPGSLGCVKSRARSSASCRSGISARSHRCLGCAKEQWDSLALSRAPQAVHRSITEEERQRGERAGRQGSCREQRTRNWAEPKASFHGICPCEATFG